MDHQEPGSAFHLPVLNDALILAFFDALRLNLNSGAIISTTILGRSVNLSGGVEELNQRHPEFDWADTCLIDSMDLMLECGISVHFGRGDNGFDVIRTLPEGVDVPAIVLHYLRKEIQKMTGKPAAPLPSSAPAVTEADSDVRNDRIARLKRLYVSAAAEPRTAAPVISAARRSAVVRPHRSGFFAGLMARLGIGGTRDKATRRLQDNISFALDTSAAKTSDSWFKALVSAEMVMVLVFTIGVVTIVMS